MNPSNLHESYFVPSWSEWRSEEVDLSQFAQNSQAIIVFRSISGMGGTLNIDNISLGASYVSMPKVSQTKVSADFYPNPANDGITFKDVSDVPVAITIIDLNGKEVKRSEVSTASPRG